MGTWRKVAGRRPRSSKHEFFQGYVAHAPMEPHTALAQVKDGRGHRLELHPDGLSGTSPRWPGPSGSSRRTSGS
jgi:hypothetical protein